MKNAAILLGLLAAAATGASAQQSLMKGGSGAILEGSPAKVRAAITLSPLLHIEFGSGPKAREAVDLDLKAAEIYEKGIAYRVDRQLKVFSIGTGYAVDVRIGNTLSKEEAGNLYRVLALGIFETGRAATTADIKTLSPAMKSLYTGGSEGERELDVVYRTRRIANENVREFNYLAGKDGGGRTYTLHLYYTITPN